MICCIIDNFYFARFTWFDGICRVYSLHANMARSFNIIDEKRFITCVREGEYAFEYRIRHADITEIMGFTLKMNFSPLLRSDKRDAADKQ